MEFKLVEQKLSQLQQQLEQVTQQVSDVEQTIENINELKNVAPGTEILVPVASGIFVNASIRNTNDLLVNVIQRFFNGDIGDRCFGALNAF